MASATRFTFLVDTPSAALARLVCLGAHGLVDERLGHHPYGLGHVHHAVVESRHQGPLTPTFGARFCAHDERLYCARGGARRNIGYSKMIWMLKRFLTEEELYGFLRDLTDLVKNYLEVKAAGARLLDDLGFPEMLSKM